MNEPLADLENHPIEGIARHGMKPFRVELFSHIEGNLWMGGNPVGEVPERFAYVLNLYAREPYDMHEGQVLTMAPFNDSEDIPGEDRLVFLARYVNACLAYGPTLVHCQAGLNRSGLISALALILNGRTPDEAIALLREKRGEIVLCNTHFEKWLRERTAELVE